MNYLLNYPKFTIKKIKGEWILGNRKIYSQKMFRNNPQAALGDVFKDYGI